MAYGKHYHKTRFNKDNDKPSWKQKLFPKKGLFLDAGCANAEMSSFVGAERYYGFDLNPYSVAYCQKKKLKVKKGSITNIPYPDNMFDCVYCNHVLEHVGTYEQHKAIQEFYRVLKPGGTLLIFMPTPYHWYFFDDPTHVRPQTHGSLRFIAEETGFRSHDAFYSLARWMPRVVQRFMRVVPMPFVFWEVCLVAKK
jgi:ubiquinone/menaquinone biosynthesis C-methylase UbiE